MHMQLINGLMMGGGGGGGGRKKKGGKKEEVDEHNNIGVMSMQKIAGSRICCNFKVLPYLGMPWLHGPHPPSYRERDQLEI